jgi:transposase
MAKGRAIEIVLDDAEKQGLKALIRKHGAPQSLAVRARIVLSAANGLTNKEIAAKLDVCAHTAGTWRNRFASYRMEGLYDEPRPGASRQIGDDEVVAAIRKTLETPPKGATHWSLRTMAKATGHSPSTIHRIWRAFGLQPHRSEALKLSSDPPFFEKVRDIVGLYLSPPERAVVLWLDEKSQVQALDRAQPLLPVRPRQAESHSRDHTRHATTSPFAALDVKVRVFTGECIRRHRAREFCKFLDEVERNTPADPDIGIIIDNYRTLEAKLIRNWFAKRPRWHVHFMPTSASWIKLVERFFAFLNDRAVTRDPFQSVAKVEAAINAYIDAATPNPKPFIWTKSADDTLA